MLKKHKAFGFMPLMKMVLGVGVLAAVMILYGPQVVAAQNLVQFDGGIGVIPVSSGAGPNAQAEVVNRNIVRGVQPAGQIWVIKDLRARVLTDGQILVKGKGLLLGRQQRWIQRQCQRLCHAHLRGSGTLHSAQYESCRRPTGRQGRLLDPGCTDAVAA